LAEAPAQGMDISLDNAKSNDGGPYGLSKGNNKTSKHSNKILLGKQKRYKVMAKKIFRWFKFIAWRTTASERSCGAATKKAPKKITKTRKLHQRERNKSYFYSE
jgi:hypothetical protein